jgi:hypothetical protein
MRIRRIIAVKGGRAFGTSAKYAKPSISAILCGAEHLFDENGIALSGRQENKIG